MHSTYLARAESAFAAGDPGRAVALAGRGLAEGEPPVPLFKMSARSLTEVLARTGLVERDLAPGPVPSRVLREGRHATSVREVVAQLQRALFGLAGAREPGAFQAIFRLAAALSDADTARTPPAGDPHPIVVSMLCCERPELLRRTVADLIASDLPPAELIFFEDASRDPRVLEFLVHLDAEPHRVHVLRNRGFSTRSSAANQNQVLAFADSTLDGFETFVTCDSDMALDKEWWSEAERIVQVAGGLRLPEGRLGAVTTFQPDSAHPCLRVAEVDGVRFRVRESVGGCQVVVPGEVYRTVLGRFDHTSDWGWSSRLRAAGRFVAATIPSRSQHLGEESLMFHTECDKARDFAFC